MVHTVELRIKKITRKMSNNVFQIQKRLAQPAHDLYLLFSIPICGFFLHPMRGGH